MNKITGYFVDPENCIAEPRTIDKSLAGYYALLRCDCITITQRRIGFRDGYFDIICDDEALLKENNFISAVELDDSPMLVGPIFVVKYDGWDDVTSLTQEELDYVARYLRRVQIEEDDRVYNTKVLTGLAY